MSLKEYGERINKERLGEAINNNEDSIEEFIIENSELTDSALVSLVVLYKGKEINEEFRKELQIHKLVENNGITEKGLEVINDPSTVGKLRDIVNK